MDQKQFATEVTLRLQRAGHAALWAGGCVRDALLGRTPKDYDVATSATPDQVRELFGFKRTLSIGAAFGVITVLGPKSAGQIEVATFRRDGGYSDGRRPDSVEFTDAREDALRRDFTINGMFFNPITAEVIDFVGGQADIARRVIRAIGDPNKRIEEDKLRMLRAVRFAATLDFTVAQETLDAIVRHAAQIDVVSPERIGAEIMRMLSHKNWRSAINTLSETKLWPYLLPAQISPTDASIAAVCDLQISPDNQFPVETILAALFRQEIEADPGSKSQPGFLRRLQSCWRLKNEQRVVVQWLAENWKTLAQAHLLRWSQVQPVVTHRYVRGGIDVARLLGGTPAAEKFCNSVLTQSITKINPSALLEGKDLIDMGMRPGPHFKTVLKTIRDEQLDGLITTVAEAKSRVQQLMQSAP